jgi:hypothetical protein
VSRGDEEVAKYLAEDFRKRTGIDVSDLMDSYMKSRGIKG